LTIMGYSLYDTVVVFDRVRDNARGIGASGRITYSDMVNLSMNQTLARSINTSLVAILPVLAVLLIGAELLGAITLQNYGLALFIGLLSGAYSSIFIASPILAIMKEREPRYTAIRQRLESRGQRSGPLTPAAAAAMGAGAAGVRSRSTSTSSGVIRPGSARGGGGGGAGTGAATNGQGSSNGSTGNRPPPRPRKGGGKPRRKRR
jgi:preprotein translocase subunit SecF